MRSDADETEDALLLNTWEIDQASGSIVVIDVLRAFTTAAYAFNAGAAEIHLTETIEEAFAFKAEHADVLTMGENHGKKPDGFNLSNSPAAVLHADLEGRVVVQSTSAGTKGAVVATGAPRAWAASLVCASATATQVNDAALGRPAYLITGCRPDSPDVTGEDDRLTARLIERVRRGQPSERIETAGALAATYEAQRLLSLPIEHADPSDVALAADVDRFGFAMEISSHGPTAAQLVRRDT